MFTFIIAVLLFPFILIIALVSLVFLSILYLRAKRRIRKTGFSKRKPEFRPDEGIEIEAKVELLQKSRVSEP